MSKETVLTDEQILDWMKTIGAYNISGYSIHGEYQFMEFARAIEKAVLESEEVEGWKKDAERWRRWLPWLRRLRSVPFSLAMEIKQIDDAAKESNHD